MGGGGGAGGDIHGLGGATKIFQFRHKSIIKNKINVKFRGHPILVMCGPGDGQNQFLLHN